MLRDDAKFFFCLTGFLGFVVFYLAASILFMDPVLGLLYGSCGCFAFSILGRLLLRYVLRGVMLSTAGGSQTRNDKISEQATESHSENKPAVESSSSVDGKSIKPLSSALKQIQKQR